MLFLSAANLLVVALVPNLILSIVLTTINAVILALLGPATTTLYSLLIPAQVRGVGMQVYAPFQLIGLVTGPILVGIVARAEMAQIIIMFTPVYAIGAVMTLSAASTVERDLRAARAANLADSESQRAKTSGINKMLVVRDVDVEYNGVKVLFHVDLDIEEGETLALLGTNGAGKSTLLRAIAGVHEASNGAIFLDGADITHAPAHENAARGVVMMPGGRAVFPSLTVAENLRSATWTLRDTDEDVEARIEQVLEFFPRLRERMDQQAGKLSGGEQQMVALGQAFLMKPRLLMIDELSLGLAPAVVDLLIDILRRIREQGTTIVVVEQSINVALTIAERAVFMEKGEILFDGPTEGLLGRPDLVRSVFMGRAASGRATSARRRGTEPDAALAVRDVAIAFGGVQALEGVSLDLAPGEILGIIGPNGAGKTTLFDVISGYLPPDAGSITLEGSDVTGLGADARARLGIGRSFQSATLFPSLTVRETITVAYERRAVKSAVLGALWTPKVRKSEAKLRSRVDGLVELLGLEAYADKFVRELSTGTRRAVDIACIMASQPKVLLLDEPSSGLAQAESEALGPALTRVVRDTGCGVILIEHDMPLITSVSDRLMAMDLGQVLATGTPSEVTSNKQVIESYLTASTDVLQRSGSRVGEAVAQLRASRDDTDGPAE
jgi:branched-chain amino acid transport system ATP-binding protein